MREIIISLVAVFALVRPILAQDGPTVTTAQGRVIGLTASDGSYHIFYGIPYAGNPSGSNRFKAPPPAPIFPGDFHATDSSKVCAQPTNQGLIGEEDCLYLNVFTKNLTTPKPVILWIDGHDYTNNPFNSQYSYRRLVQKDVVVVSINYRLSIFGFLCLGVEEAPGNAGLKDIIAGLRWINQNIAAFGGNPDNVMLFGHGSGAAIADLVSLSPLAQNLFHKVIASSGNALAPWAVAYNPVQNAELLGIKLGYTEKSTAELAQAFIETDFTVLGSSLSGFSFLNNTALFAPCIENVLLQNDTALPDAPINIIRSGNYSHVPYITGYTNREGTLRTHQALFEDWFGQLQSNFADSLQADIKSNSTTNQTALAQTIRQFYFGSDIINLAAIEDYFDYQGDTMFLISTIRVARERALTSQAPVRLYEFQYRGTLNSDWAFAGVTITGARHGSVLNYLFDYDLSPSDIAAQQNLLTRWVTFANTGVPTTGTGGPMVNWDPITVTSSGVPAINYLKFEGGEVAVNQSVFVQVIASGPHEQRRVFWDGIYASHYVPPSPVSAADNMLALVFIVVLSQIVARLF